MMHEHTPNYSLQLLIVSQCMQMQAQNWNQALAWNALTNQDLAEC
jgi:hypothetical protein